MLPTLEGIIARRILVNFRADPDVAQRLIPKPLQVATQNGFAVVGICLIRLEHLRPKGLPAFVGLSSENMAHRIAIRYPTDDGMKDGVFIWRRETDQCLVTLLGGRLFPGVHQRAEFCVTDVNEILAMKVQTERQEADVSFSAQPAREWTATPLFSTADEANSFFQKGDCGFSCALHADILEGMQLEILRWQTTPLHVSDLHAAFYENPARFPSGSLEFDCALLMQDIAHEWHELDSLPELAGAIRK